MPWTDDVLAKQQSGLCVLLAGMQVKTSSILPQSGRSATMDAFKQRTVLLLALIVAVISCCTSVKAHGTLLSPRSRNFIAYLEQNYYWSHGLNAGGGCCQQAAGKSSGSTRHRCRTDGAADALLHTASAETHSRLLLTYTLNSRAYYVINKAGEGMCSLPTWKASSLPPTNTPALPSCTPTVALAVILLQLHLAISKLLWYICCGVWPWLWPCSAGNKVLGEYGRLTWPAMNLHSLCGDAPGETKWEAAGAVQATYTAGQVMDIDSVIAVNHLVGEVI